MPKTKKFYFVIIGVSILLFTAFMLFSISHRSMSENRVEAATNTESEASVNAPISDISSQQFEFVISEISVYPETKGFLILNDNAYARMNMSPSWAEGEYPYAKDGYFHIAAEGDLNGFHVNITASLKQGSAWEDIKIPAAEGSYSGNSTTQGWTVTIS